MNRRTRRIRLTEAGSMKENTNIPVVLIVTCSGTVPDWPN